MIPFWGSGRASVNDFQTGHWIAGSGQALLALSDAFLVKSLITAGAKLLVEGGAKVLAEDAVEGAAKAVDAKGGTYLLRDPETGQVMRTGRTNDLLRREAEHARDPVLKDLEFESVHRTDVYEEQRGLEQMLHDTYNPPLNKIRPISPSNPNLQGYLDAANGYLGKP